MVSGEPGSDPRSAEPFAFTDSDERPLGQVMRTPARTRTPQARPRCAQPSPLGHNVRSSRADDYYLTEGAGLAERYVACPLSTDAADFGTIRVDRQMSRRATSEQVIFVEPKTEASTRTVQVADVLLDAIAEHVERFGAHQTGLVLTSEIATPLRTSTLDRAWTIATRNVGTQATPHDLRDYVASMQIAGGT